MQKQRTPTGGTATELLCRHGTRLQDCSICQLSLPNKEFMENIGERIKAARPRLLRLAQLNGIGPDEAEDVAQETLLEAWRHLERLYEPEGFATWLDAICRNVCKRHIHARATSVQTSELPVSEDEGQEAQDLLLALPDPLAIDPVAELERQDMQVLLDHALGHLSESARELIELCYLAEMPQREVAQRLDMSLGALELKLHRARRQLHQVLHGELREDAHAFGLLLDEDEAMGWQETRYWCWTCGQQRLRATFELQPSGIRVFRVRCPDCSPRYAPHYDSDLVHTDEFRRIGAMPSFHLVGVMRSFRPALKRTMLDVADYSATVFGQRRCPICQAPVQIDLIDQNTLDSMNNVPAPLPPGIFLRIACPNCKPYICGFSSALLMDQDVLTFLLERPRVHYTPSIMDTCEGQDAIRSRLLDLNSGERLTIMTHPQTLQIMATIFEK
jgi:RNA polymerase sigma factor (sigma-70 family)